MFSAGKWYLAKYHFPAENIVNSTQDVRAVCRRGWFLTSYVCHKTLFKQLGWQNITVKVC